MPQYGAMCGENIRSGKVLLELSDSELESGLGINNTLHRRKLRLAIEELRDPRRRRFPKISMLDHNWVSSEWLPDLGLPQYAETFANNLVDGRVLDTLSKRDLEKHLGLLAEKRHQCENFNCDPVVWTNYRWVKWAQSIDLIEYAANLKDSGIHGALVVLEHSFSVETMATALGIQSSKSIIRRHLATEFENLIIPSRKQMDEQARLAKMEKRRQEKMGTGGSLGRSFVGRTYATLDKGDKDKRRSSLRGSLSRALGLKVREEVIYQNGLNSTENMTYATPRSLPIQVPGSYPVPPSHSPYIRNGSYHEASRYIGRPLPNPHSVQALPGSLQERPRSSVVPSSTAAFSQRESHRRVRSIGDIEHFTVTPV
ncbi:Kazrin [Armadillidium vulgare]|nr:Kazrin [Armadillidium vulgare]